MLDYINNFKIIAEHCFKVKAGEQVLVLVDNTARPIVYGEALRDVINSMGAEATLMIVNERPSTGVEPNRATAAAMMNCDMVVTVVEKLAMAHTKASKEAINAGVRFCNLRCAPEEYFKRPVSLKDYDEIEDRTVKMALLLTEAKIARVTSLAGTDITMSLEGRTAAGNHPKAGAAPLPGHGEATLAPVEGSANGVVVVDIHLGGFGLVHQPVSWKVEKGRIVGVEGQTGVVQYLQNMLSKDDGANVICQLAVGTSHLIPQFPTGNEFDRGRIGRIHIAFGMNNDGVLRGNNTSLVHVDGLFGDTNLDLDGKRVIENERLLF